MAIDRTYHVISHLIVRLHRVPACRGGWRPHKPANLEADGRMMALCTPRLEDRTVAQQLSRESVPVAMVGKNRRWGLLNVYWRATTWSALKWLYWLSRALFYAVIATASRDKVADNTSCCGQGPHSLRVEILADQFTAARTKCAKS